MKSADDDDPANMLSSNIRVDGRRTDVQGRRQINIVQVKLCQKIF